MVAKYISVRNSSDILRFLYGAHAHEERAQFLRPTEEALAMEREIDELGIHLRR